MLKLLKKTRYKQKYGLILAGSGFDVSRKKKDPVPTLKKPRTREKQIRIRPKENLFDLKKLQPFF